MIYVQNVQQITKCIQLSQLFQNLPPSCGSASDPVHTTSNFIDLTLRVTDRFDGATLPFGKIWSTSCVVVPTLILFRAHPDNSASLNEVQNFRSN